MSILSAIRISRRPALGFMAIGMLFGSFAAQVPMLKAQVGADDSLFGLILLASPVGLLTCLWIAPHFDRRFGAQALRVAGMAVALSFLAPGWATGPWGLLLALIAVGLASGLVDIVSNARVSELEALHSRSLMNANHGMFSLAYAAAAILTGLAREAGLSSATIFTAFSVVVLLSCFWMHTPVAHVSEEERRASRLPVVIVLLCGGVVLCAFFLEAVVESWSALHVERTLGGRAAEGALAPAILGLTMAAGRLMGQSVAHRFADTAIIGIGSVMACAGAFVAAVAPAPAIAYLGFAIIGLGTSVVGPLALAMVGRLVPPAQRVRAVAHVNVMGFSAYVFAPAVMGAVSDAFGLRWAFAVVGALGMIAPFLALSLRARQGPLR